MLYLGARLWRDMYSDPHVVRQHGQSGPLAAPQLGPCASSGRASAAADSSALPGERPAHWAPSRCLGCLSAPPPKPPISPHLTVHLTVQARLGMGRLLHAIDAWLAAAARRDPNPLLTLSYPYPYP